MELLADFPDALGSHQISRRTPIAGDASGRRYWRVALDDGESAILCRYPDRWLPIVKRDLEVLYWLRDRELPVPRILAGDVRSLWVLLEDLGSIDGEQALMGVDPSVRTALVCSFLEPLYRLSALPVEQLPRWNPPLDQAFLRWELSGFEMWALPPSIRGISDSSIRKWLDGLASSVAEHPRSICLRDFHLNNILVAETGEVGIIDVQDLRSGPDTYDLASVLSDRAMPELLTSDQPSEVARIWAETVGALPGWEHRLEETSLQRALKVLGTFAFLHAKGMNQYLRWVPRTASIAAEIAQKLGAPANATAILLDLASTGGFDVW